MQPRIALFSSFYNEANHVSRVVESVAQQTYKPAIWVIADDGSTDDTFSILQRAIHKYNWIHVIRLPLKKKKDILTAGRGWRAAIRHILATGEEYDYFGKIDGDIIIPPYYFERLVRFMSKNPKIMACSGCVYSNQSGKWVFEGNACSQKFILSNSARGACFLVKRELFLQVSVNDFPDTAPDDFFNAKAKILGYYALQINVPMYQLRPTTKLSPKKLGMVLRYYGANPIHVIGIAIFKRSNIKERVNLFRGYFTFKGKKIKDKDVRRFYSLGEVLKRHTRMLLN